MEELKTRVERNFSSITPEEIREKMLGNPQPEADVVEEGCMQGFGPEFKQFIKDMKDFYPDYTACCAESDQCESDDDEVMVAEEGCMQGSGPEFDQFLKDFYSDYTAENHGAESGQCELNDDESIKKNIDLQSVSIFIWALLQAFHNRQDEDGHAITSTDHFYKDEIISIFSKKMATQNLSFEEGDVDPIMDYMKNNGWVVTGLKCIRITKKFTLDLHLSLGVDFIIL